MISTTASASTSDAGLTDRNATLRWATWTRRHPRPAKAGWVLLLVASMAIGSWSEVRLASTHAMAGDPGRPVSVAAAAGSGTANAGGTATETVVFGGRGRLAAATVAAVRSDLAISLSRVPGVKAVGAPVMSADGGSAVVTVTSTAADASALHRAVDRVRARHPGLDVTIPESPRGAALTVAA